MKILFAASEATPFIASGGLADVAGSLPRALLDEGAVCRVIMPLYSAIKPELRQKLRYIGNFTVPVAWREQYCGLFEAPANGVKYYFLDNEYYFRRNSIYGFYDDAERFSFFSRALVEAVRHINFIPDVLHANDWQTALAPVYLDFCYKERNPVYNNIKTLLTIHNIGYQGQYGPELMESVLGIEPKYFSVLACNDGRGGLDINFLKAGIERANKISTVSRTYARELLDPWYAHGLDGLLRERSFKLSGILNGIDTKLYNPGTDTALWKNYSAETVEDKSVNRSELLKSLNLPEDGNSLVLAMVTRLAAHKGLDLVKYIFEEMLSHGVRVIILGTGEMVYEGYFGYMQEKHPDKVRFINGFVPDFARKIYAGADAFLMPSKSEPCGLSQMIAARYGTIPIVRETGGLADTIRDEGGENPNGFTFKTYNAHDMLGAVDRAKGVFSDKDRWRRLQRNAMNCDFSWAVSAKQYIDLYNSL
ncbi:MAG: glycogen synthase [Oscillospiraceae bacterium]|jgi:starch synthase|nr:glycogen synthase [Oscillospiraceae bacterium]